ncbi:hypothetical protein GCK72_004925 [Caenorhabditis remanei]|uniref:Protein kinase domain-containing protein n=1 Tax=Caenorhabditis remanei TaxID=31234 RepID=A0A6A5HDP7_CAERE|nr:hypothetical protein GCK72_004925 [Caenorhabditis remanei]KAF1764974.1 hypothetical protein GCK72_004925 [Caenorhabditis remanei]
MALLKENANGENNAAELNFSIGEIVSGFKLVKKIDEGGFGQVYKVTKDDKTFYAMKLESNFLEGGSAIKLEINVLNQLPRESVFPAFISGGKKTKFQFLVLELLGDNLKVLKSKSPNPDVFSDGTWSRVGIQCLYAIKKMHDAGFVHRDIKPNNFAIGISTATETRSRRILLFDFGLARKFIQTTGKKVSNAGVSKKVDKGGSKRKTHHSKVKTAKSKMTAGASKLSKTKSKHVPAGAKLEQNKKKNTIQNRFLVGPQENQGSIEEVAKEEEYMFRVPRPHTDFRGTHQYASPNAHLQKELGRHDDIWSLMYMIAEFFIELPWSNNEEIPVESLKDQASLLRLFFDEKYPTRLTPKMQGQLNEIDQMLKDTNYYTHPNYDVVYQFLSDVMKQSGTLWETPYDWEMGKQSEMDKSRTVKIIKKDFAWERGDKFFKFNRWIQLKLPSQSPPVSTKQFGAPQPTSVIGFTKKDFRKFNRQASKEEVDDGEVLVEVGGGGQKSMKKEMEVVESKKEMK